MCGQLLNLNQPGRYTLRTTLVSLTSLIHGLPVLVYLQRILMAVVSHLDVTIGPIVWDTRSSGMMPDCTAFAYLGKVSKTSKVGWVYQVCAIWAPDAQVAAMTSVQIRYI